MGKTSIEWTERTWNPLRGCSMASGSETGGCLNCYAARIAARNLPELNSPTTGEPFAVLRPSGPRWTGKVELIDHLLAVPLRRRKPTTWFVNSMSDLFHESLPDEVIDRVFAVMALCPQHTFQVLTKRAERMREYFQQTPLPKYGPDVVAFDGTHARVFARMVAIMPRVDAHALNRAAEKLEELYPGEEGFMRRWPLPNVWLGVSCENQPTAGARIPHLLQTPAAVRFISAEPLLGPVDLSEYLGASPSQCSPRWCKHPFLDWVIVGGESGPGARPMNPDWARLIRDQCGAAGVPFFFKQWGEYCDWDQMPDDTVRELDANGHAPNHPDIPYRVGKQGAGSFLDGCEWKQVPEVNRG